MSTVSRTRATFDFSYHREQNPSSVPLCPYSFVSECACDNLPLFYSFLSFSLGVRCFHLGGGGRRGKRTGRGSPRRVARRAHSPSELCRVGRRQVRLGGGGDRELDSRNDEGRERHGAGERAEPGGRRGPLAGEVAVHYRGLHRYRSVFGHPFKLVAVRACFDVE